MNNLVRHFRFLSLTDFYWVFTIFKLKSNDRSTQGELLSHRWIRTRHRSPSPGSHCGFYGVRLVMSLGPRQEQDRRPVRNRSRAECSREEPRLWEEHVWRVRLACSNDGMQVRAEGWQVMRAEMSMVENLENTDKQKERDKNCQLVQYRGNHC